MGRGGAQRKRHLWDKGDPGSRMGALRHTFSPWRPGSDPQGPGQEPDPHAVCLRLPSPTSEAPQAPGLGVGAEREREPVL